MAWALGSPKKGNLADTALLRYSIVSHRHPCITQTAELMVVEALVPIRPGASTRFQSLEIVEWLTP
jgi:hypothetical protein